MIWDIEFFYDGGTEGTIGVDEPAVIDKRVDTRTHVQTVSGLTVHREVMAIGDPTTDGRIADVLNAAPAGTEDALAVRQVGVLTANQGGAPWSMRVQDGVGATLVTVKSAVPDAADNAQVVTDKSAGVADSSLAYGTVTAPTAGQAIATLGAPAAGTYVIYVSMMCGIFEGANLEFREGAMVRLGGLNGNTVTSTYGPLRRTLDGATALSINATGAGTAGVRYDAQIWATRVG